MLETYVACRGEKKIKKFFLAWLSILRKFLNIDDMSSHNRHVDSSLHRSTSNIKSSIYCSTRAAVNYVTCMLRLRTAGSLRAA